MERLKNHLLTIFLTIFFSFTAFSQSSMSCLPPQQPYIISTTSNFALIGWDVQNATDAFRVELRLASNNELIQSNNHIQANQYLFSNLQAETTYKALIYRWCGTGNDTKLSAPSEIIIKTVIEDIVIWVTDPNNPSVLSRMRQLPELCTASCKFSQTFNNYPNSLILNFLENEYQSVELVSHPSNRQWYYFKMNIGYDVLSDKIVICGQVNNVPVSTKLSEDKKTLYIQTQGINLFSINYSYHTINARQQKEVFLNITPFINLNINTCKTSKPSNAQSIDDTSKISQRSNSNQSITNYNTKIIVSPNPIIDDAHLYFDIDEKPISIRIYNLQRQVVYQQNLGETLQKEGKIEIKTGSLLRGVYLLEVTTAYSSIIQKIVKQ